VSLTLPLVVLAILWVAIYILLRKLAGLNPQEAAPPHSSPSRHLLMARYASITKNLPLITEIVAATGLLALATTGFFWQILLTSESWMPAGGGDLAPFLYPNYHFAAKYLRQGIIPLWNPHLYSGMPFAADIQSGLFYPINLLVFLLTPDLTYEWLEYLAIFHFWLAGVTMYLFLRLLLIPTKESNLSQAQGHDLAGVQSELWTPKALSPLAAFAGAIAYEFSDLFIVHFGNLNMIAVAAWLPLVFLLFHHSLLQASFGLAAVGGVVLALTTLAGHIQITLFIVLTLGLYALWHFGVRPFIALLITLLVTIGLSALLLFPAYELSQYTRRAELPYQEAARYSLHPVQLVGLLAPGYFGRDPALHWGPWERVETGYIGLMTLILAVIGVLLYPGRLKGFFIALGILALLLALGGYSFLHGWLYALAPGFDQLRAPARFILLLDFCLATLAAFGLNQLLQPLDQQARPTLSRLLRVLTWSLGGLIIVAAPLSYYALLITQDRNPVIFNRAAGATSAVMTFALFAIASLLLLHLVHKGWLREKQAGLAMIVIIGVDLFTLGHNVDVGHARPTTGFDHPEAIAFLRADPNHYRIEVTTDVWHAWQPNTALLHAQYDVWGLYNPLTLADMTLYWSGAPPRSSGRYNFLGVKYIIASKAGAPADGDIVSVFEGDPDINIYLNRAALARVLLVGRAVTVPDHDAAWAAIRADDFDPTTTVIVEGGQPLETRPNSALTILEYGLHTVTIAVETDQPGYLVLSDAYYPGWQATVDGQPEPIRRANFAFRAVYVPAGQHIVKFVFTPIIWKTALGVSGLTLLLLSGWAIGRLML
jgi:hypothetical protein